MKFRIGLDLGGTKTEVILTTENPLELIAKKRIPTEQEKGYAHILKQTAALLQEMIARSPSPPSLGVGIPGNLSLQTNRVKNSNTACLIHQPFLRDLEGELNRKVHMENDANCFALAEALYGAGKGKNLVLGVILGTGVGGGIVFQGQLFKGPNGIAGEWGHSTLDYHGRDCWCGRKGCLETYLSGPAMEQRYRELSGKPLALIEIEQRRLAGEPAALQLTQESLKLFGEAMANLIVCFDPDVLVLGGGVSNLPWLYTQGLAEVEKRLFDEALTTKIVKNQLGDSAGVYGAALLGE